MRKPPHQSPMEPIWTTYSKHPLAASFVSFKHQKTHDIHPNTSTKEKSILPQAYGEQKKRLTTTPHDSQLLLLFAEWQGGQVQGIARAHWSTATRSTSGRNCQVSRISCPPTTTGEINRNKKKNQLEQVGFLIGNDYPEAPRIADCAHIVKIHSQKPWPIINDWCGNPSWLYFSSILIARNRKVGLVWLLASQGEFCSCFWAGEMLEDSVPFKLLGAYWEFLINYLYFIIQLIPWTYLNMLSS